MSKSTLTAKKRKIARDFFSRGRTYRRRRKKGRRRATGHAPILGCMDIPSNSTAVNRPLSKWGEFLALLRERRMNGGAGPPEKKRTAPAKKRSKELLDDGTFAFSRPEGQAQIFFLPQRNAARPLVVPATSAKGAEEK